MRLILLFVNRCTKKSKNLAALKHFQDFLFLKSQRLKKLSIFWLPTRNLRWQRTNSVDKPICHLVLLGVHNNTGVLWLYAVRSTTVLTRAVCGSDAVRFVRVRVTLRQCVLYARVHVGLLRLLLLLLSCRLKKTGIVVGRVCRRATRECPLLKLLLFR